MAYGDKDKGLGDTPSFFIGYKDVEREKLWELLDLLDKNDVEKAKKYVFRWLEDVV